MAGHMSVSSSNRLHTHCHRAQNSALGLEPSYLPCPFLSHSVVKVELSTSKEV